MTPTTEDDTASGAFSSRTPWPPIGAVAASALIVLTAVAIAGGLGALYFAGLKASGGGGPQSFSQTSAMLLMLMMQAIIVALVIWLAGWRGGERNRVLSLLTPLTARLFLFGLTGMVLLLAPYNVGAYLLWPKDFTQDLRPFAELARSPAAPVAALVVAIGAPLSEELLFRGFLLPAMAAAGARTFVGIALAGLVLQMLAPLWFPLMFPGRFMDYSTAGLVFGVNLALLLIAAFAWWRRSEEAPSRQAFILAALFTTTAWTLMHLGYSAMGLTEVFMIGIYFCWLMWRTGSLRLTIALHALYNGLQLLVLTVVPLPAPG